MSTAVAPVASTPASTPTPSARLWSRDFTLYFAARTVSLLGDALLPVALATGLLAAGYGASGVGWALAAWMAPIAVLIPFGGALADKFGARRMMIGADAVRLVVQGCAAMLFLTGVPTLWQVLVLQAISGAATAVFQPGTAGLTVQVASDVQRANGALRVAEAMTALLGPALAGLLVAMLNAGAVLAFDAATFAVSGLCLLALRVAAVTVTTGTNMARSLVEGWREFRQRTWLWTVIAIWAVYGLLVFGPVVPLGAALIVGAHGATAYGIVTSVFGAGTIAGGLLGMWLRPRRPLAAGATAMLLFACCPLVLAAGADLPLLCLGHLIGGAGFAFWGVMWATTVQTQIPAPVLNRVYAYDVAGSILILPIGRALAGPVALLAGSREVLAFSTVFALLACGLLLSAPAVRTLRRVEPAQGTGRSARP
ncbi:MFS transporter [Catellatospora methionotrophica]|uniref:MFS transporter n=1 Tax=Catellatospora methionotrophica TaxID=121620 RepID=A0A8J3L3N7_9ACTN|nr:MFS transporter [Catellatospora methionotrophica]GIG11900.1 MFS transporter [Catellatospora methionotrophica]